MNNDLISMADTLDRIKTYFCVYCTALKIGCCGDGCKIKRVIDMINAAPTVDAEPVRHGRWIVSTQWKGKFGEIYSQCSVCGTIYPVKKGSRGDGKGGKFCEECGAKMHVEVEDAAD